MKMKILFVMLVFCMVISVVACDNNIVPLTNGNEVTESNEKTERKTEVTEATNKLDSNGKDNTDLEKDKPIKDAAELVNGMRPEFKKAMDSYEVFYENYCDVIKKYKSNPVDLTILAEYTELMQKSVEMSEKFEAWDEGELSDAELKYYLEVNGRVTKMLLEVSGQ